MDEARKKLRICLIFIVAIAVIIGMIYFFSDMRNKNDVSEGTLVRQIETGTLQEKGNLTGR
ncbi:MAG: hypothetical protein ACI4S2_09030 [Lachnospiraceae bacterium]